MHSFQKPEAQKHFSLAAESLPELAEVNPAHCFGTAISAVVDYLTLRSTLAPVTYGAKVRLLAWA